MELAISRRPLVTVQFVTTGEQEAMLMREAYSKLVGTLGGGLVRLERLRGEGGDLREDVFAVADGGEGLLEG